MMADAQQTIDLVDRYEGGLVTQDELVSLHNFKNLAETFYSPPAWLHGQIRQYELRRKDEAIAKAAEAAATSSPADALARQVSQQQEEIKRAAEAAKQLRRVSARPEVSAVIADLHGEVKRSAQVPGGAVSLIDYAASLLDGTMSKRHPPIIAPIETFAAFCPLNSLVMLLPVCHGCWSAFALLPLCCASTRGQL